MTAPDVSILIATRNRGGLLSQVLDSLKSVAPSAPAFEIVVVDNGSDDGSLETAKRVARDHPSPVRVVSEPRLGLSRARNTAVAAALGQILVFLDDDALVGEGWLQQLCSPFSDPTVSAVGGGVKLRFNGEPPPWLTEALYPYLSAWNLGQEVVPLRYNEYPRGANMALRAEVFQRFGGYHERLGRRGARLRSCEETELFLRLERGGGRILYVPGCEVEHIVSVARLTEPWMRRRFFAQGESEALLEFRHGGFAVLRHGLERTRRTAELGQSLTFPINACLRETYRGYRQGALKAPFLMRRYVGDGDGRVADEWQPLGIP